MVCALSGENLGGGGYYGSRGTLCESPKSHVKWNTDICCMIRYLWSLEGLGQGKRLLSCKIFKRYILCKDMYATKTRRNKKLLTF